MRTTITATYYEGAVHTVTGKLIIGDRDVANGTLSLDPYFEEVLVDGEPTDDPMHEDMLWDVLPSMY